VLPSSPLREFNLFIIMNSHLCPLCGESKDVSRARVEHVRLGLDEPPEPILCMCKTPNEVMDGITTRMADVSSVLRTSKNMTMDMCPKPNANAVRIWSVSKYPHVELELRMNGYMSRSAFRCMDTEVFGHVTRRRITEEGCCWWTGTSTNTNAKVRERSNGQRDVKVLVYKYRLAPGISIAMSHEYKYEGEILRPDYKTVMDEISCPVRIANQNMVLISRKYVNENVETYACEVELEVGITHMALRMVLNEIVSVVGFIPKLRNEVDEEFMSSVLFADHAVLDVSNMNGQKGVFMLKADGMKVYVFCYSFGYLITFPDRDLTVVSCMFSALNLPLYEYSYKPDVMVAEMMSDGSLVYIDTLSKNGNAYPITRPYSARPSSLYSYPSMTLRVKWDSVPPPSVGRLSGMANDGLVCVTASRTVRMKPPTIDLKCTSGWLCASESGSQVRLVESHSDMKANVIYELSVSAGLAPNTVVIANPHQRMIKKNANNMDVIKRAFMSVSKQPDMNTSLFDVTNASFCMRARVYEMAQAAAITTRRVIMVFGAGRFQEWKQMRHSHFSYIAIDPDVTITKMMSSSSKVTFLPYDMNRSLSVQVSSISRRPGTVLYCRTRSEHFISVTNALEIMGSMGVPAVFSFSISYHIRLINTLWDSNVNVFGCGYVHDGMNEDSVIGSNPITMRVRRSTKDGSLEVVSTFGKSTYVEPFLSRDSVRGLHGLQHTMSDVWTSVDAITLPIMSRAVIMY